MPDASDVDRLQQAVSRDRLIELAVKLVEVKSPTRSAAAVAVSLVPPSRSITPGNLAA